MGGKEDDFLKRLLVTFRVEADEHLRAIAAGLIELEVAPSGSTPLEVVERIFREAHSLKGAARAVNLTAFEALCQSLEGVLAALNSQELSPSLRLFDLMHRTVDSLNQELAGVDLGGDAGGRARLIALARQLDDARRGSLAPLPLAEVPRPMSRPPTEGAPLPLDTVRVSAARLDALLLQAEELLAGKLAAAQRAAELGEAAAQFATWKREWARFQLFFRAAQPAHGDSDARLTRWAEFIEWSRQCAPGLEERLSTLARSAERDSRALGGMVDALLEDMKRALMLPFSTVTESFPRFVRELTRDQNKEVELIIRGGEIEVDRRILEEMKDPLIHLVRNCIDHGLERPEARDHQGKPRRGTVTIAIAQKNGQRIEVLIADDGAGIDLDGVRAAAIKRGLVSSVAAAQMSEAETLALVYQSGLSTSPLITDISGRGLGLAIVQEKAEQLGGSVTMDTTPGVGTTFRLNLPLTLATFRGLLVDVGGGLFVLPGSHVERALRVKREEISTVENRETIPYDGGTLALARLADVLELPLGRQASESEESAQVVVLAAGEKRIGFVVDEVLAEQEVLVKTLGPQLARVRSLAGATVLGSGKVVPILSAPDLLKSAARAAGRAPRPAAAPEGVAEPRSILVVEDSITSRTLLKTILESAGYAVRTAVDGAEGYATLKNAVFDLVVSDVDMPRLNGFELTAKIRADKKLAKLPVVLVTALEAREDYERGAEVGADAYIVKSSFDQGNLLDAVRRLI